MTNPETHEFSFGHGDDRPHDVRHEEYNRMRSAFGHGPGITAEGQLPQEVRGMVYERCVSCGGATEHVGHTMADRELKLSWRKCAECGAPFAYAMRDSMSGDAPAPGTPNAARGEGDRPTLVHTVPRPINGATLKLTQDNSAWGGIEIKGLRIEAGGGTIMFTIVTRDAPLRHELEILQGALGYPCGEHGLFMGHTLPLPKACAPTRTVGLRVWAPVPILGWEYPYLVTWQCRAEPSRRAARGGHRPTADQYEGCGD